jgi:hypothetical protein
LEGGHTEPTGRLGSHHGRLSSSPSCPAPAYDAEDDQEDTAGHYHHPAQREAGGEGDTIHGKGGVLNKGRDVLLGHCDILVQLHVEKAMGILHGNQCFNPCLSLAGLPGQQGIHRLVTSGINLKLLQPEHLTSNVDRLVHAVVVRVEAHLLATSKVEGGCHGALRAGKATRKDSQVVLVVNMHKDSTGGAWYPGSPDLQLIDRELQVVAWVEVVCPTQGGKGGHPLGAIDRQDVKSLEDSGDIPNHRAIPVHVETDCPEVGSRWQVGFGRQEDGMSDSHLPCPDSHKDVLKLVNVLQYYLIIHIEPSDLANILIVLLGKLVEMTSQHLLLVGNIADDVRHCLLVRHLAHEGGGHLVPDSSSSWRYLASSFSVATPVNACRTSPRMFLLKRWTWLSLSVTGLAGGEVRSIQGREEEVPWVARVLREDIRSVISRMVLLARRRSSFSTSCCPCRSAAHSCMCSLHAEGVDRLSDIQHPVNLIDGSGDLILTGQG